MYAIKILSPTVVVSLDLRNSVWASSGDYDDSGGQKLDALFMNQCACQQLSRYVHVHFKGGGGMGRDCV